jgi:hypothetical protein
VDERVVAIGAGVRGPAAALAAWPDGPSSTTDPAPETAGATTA